MTFAQQLKSERKRLGLTQVETDALLGLGKGQCAAWEIERNDPLAVTKKGVLDTLRSIEAPLKLPSARVAK